MTNIHDKNNSSSSSLLAKSANTMPLAIYKIYNRIWQGNSDNVTSTIQIHIHT